ncbi:MAG: peptide deformylase [Patescibacteria group bacterium]|nr:peptide deformylase [Patescibacteria group bacterium]
MDIITAPHTTLRTKANPVKNLDNKMIDFIHNLATSLEDQQDPPGVGLAGPQVNRKIRAFAIRPVENRSSKLPSPQVFVNPKIVDHSTKQVLGVDEKKPDLEGCLSIPKIYGPVLRWEWVDLKYQILKKNKLIKKKQRFKNFTARIVQHELDHLNGVLFTDYLLKHNLPAYIKEKNGLVELSDRSILQVY